MLLSKVSEGFEERGGTVFFLRRVLFGVAKKSYPSKMLQ